ncbi:hypothetical protein M728_005654 (plasmid) [Ensifer sp. WSM1721]
MIVAERQWLISVRNEIHLDATLYVGVGVMVSMMGRWTAETERACSVGAIPHAFFHATCMA